MFNQDKFNQLNETIQFNEKQSILMMSNYYFDLLLELKNEGKLKANHIPFTYAYIYFMTYMFRYTRYDVYIPKVSEIKELLGYSAIDKKLNYIIKDGGLLDNENILKAIYDFPVIHEYDRLSNDLLQFTFISDFDDWYINEWKNSKGIKNNQSSKYPVLAFYQFIEDFEDIIFHDEGGTFFETYEVTIIPFQVFNYCMSHEEIGVTGFYIYSFLQYKNNLFTDYKATYQTIAKKIGLSAKTVQRYMETMRSYNLIQTIHNMEYFSTGISQEHRQASTHKVNNFEDFTYQKIEYDKLKVVNKYEHIKKMEEKKKEKSTQLVDISIDELPY